ncbi:MAG TPA: Ig-like domain-containing protein [Kofleriaceae bacterium]|nr:Ig-like domain-containing protein [Kofleriaceae bacterium]
MKSELVPEGPPVVTEVNVLSEIFDPNIDYLTLGERATFCREGEEYKVNQFYCPVERDDTGAPIPGVRGVEPHTQTIPHGQLAGYSDIWHVRLIFDELLDPNVEDLVEVDGVTIGTIADTRPVILTCGGNPVAYDGFYDPSGNHLSYPPGPALVVTTNEFVATGSACQIAIDGNAVTDKDGEAVPADQRGPYDFAIAPLAIVTTAPANEEEGVDPAATIDLELNAPVDPTTAVASITLQDEGGADVPFTVALAPADPTDPEAGELPNVLSIIPDAPLDPEATYTVTVDSGIADIAGGELTLDEPLTFSFTTAPAA